MKLKIGAAVLIGAIAIFLAVTAAANGRSHLPVPGRVEVTFSGGYDLDPRDGGRPVRLIAGALGVSPEVFREAFRHVTPAPGGHEPDRGQVHRNKEALLRALGPYGITNERLDAVSDYYRYNPGRGEMWPTRPARAYAVVVDGAIKRFVITDPGAGYTSSPTVSLPGSRKSNPRVTLVFGSNFAKNGSVSSIKTP